MVMKSTPRGGEEVLVGGILAGVKSAKSRKGEMYAQGGLEDMTGRSYPNLFGSLQRLQER